MAETRGQTAEARVESDRGGGGLGSGRADVSP